MVLTPQGRISRYFYGVDFPPKDLRMGLVEASQNKIGNAVDAVLLYCYHYDPATGKYGAMVGNILRLAAGATILILGALFLYSVEAGSFSNAEDGSEDEDRLCSIIFHYGRSRPRRWRAAWTRSTFSC